jgi:hydrogenase assembly chaperone HypC/HupF
MCALIPAQIIALQSDAATVSDGVKQYTVHHHLRVPIALNDWVFVNAGEIVGVVSAAEAQTIRELWQELLGSDSVQ